eukprot:TRINITY_DN17497_c0_g1_i1.p1 TRINITY_DN17497_c0_g1~~TRINITY_DN17497_c0_g1_i1.p1  ORF type:complete len:687 (-),score=110.62 TRINITY_DN17497_c0_g1_i1:71-2131(-)
MLDVKELFRHERWKQLHADGLPAQAPNGLRRGALWPEAPAQDARSTGAWQCFPDPAVLSLLQGRAERAQELLAACGSSLQLCMRGAANSRRFLRTCRAELEDHQASSTAVRTLLGGQECSTPDEPENFCAAEAAIANNSAERLAPLARRKICVGRVRCYFCRERRALEEAVDTMWLPCEGPSEGDDWAIESAMLADASSCCDSSAIADEVGCMHGRRASSDEESPDPNEKPAGTASPRRQMVQRRRTSRERGRPIFKAPTDARGMFDKTKSSERTWYAMHTMDPSVEQANHQGASNLNASEDQGLATPPQMTVPAASWPKGPPPFGPAEVVSQPCMLGPTVAATLGNSSGSAPVGLADAADVDTPTLHRGEKASAAACIADAAELEPYTSAAARFRELREEMEVLDLSSYPGSPGAEQRNILSDQGLAEKKVAAASPARRGRAWSWEPSTPATAGFRDGPPPPPPPLPRARTKVLDASIPPPPPHVHLQRAQTKVLDARWQQGCTACPAPTATLPRTQTLVLNDSWQQGCTTFPPPPPMTLPQTQTQVLDDSCHFPPPPPTETGPSVETLSMGGKGRRPGLLSFRWLLLLRRFKAKLASDPATLFFVFQRWAATSRQRRGGGTTAMTMGVVHQPAVVRQPIVVHQPICPSRPASKGSSRRPSKPGSPMLSKPQRGGMGPRVPITLE